MYGPLVESWCVRAGTGAATEDVRQEVFRAVAGGLTGFRRDRPGDTFRGWLRGVTRNKLRDYFRATAGRTVAAGGTDARDLLHTVPAPPDGPDEDDPAEATALYHRGLELVRAEFEPRTWEAFWRSAVEGHETAAVAVDLGVTPAAVRKAKSRVLYRLRQEVGDLLD